MKTVGILGGVGPETTANFYLNIIAESQRIGGDMRPNMLINNLPIPYAIEREALLHGKNVEKFLPYLLEQAKILQQSGVDFIVMPCNTLHRFEEDIRASLDIPFISIVDTVASFLNPQACKKVGFIATSITLESEFYQRRCRDIGVQCISPNSFQQVKIAKMIHGLVTGKYANNQRDVLIEIIEDFAKQGVKQTMLACTDLQALIPHHPEMMIVDTMQLLADEVVQQIHAHGGSYKRRVA